MVGLSPNQSPAQLLRHSLILAVAFMILPAAMGGGAADDNGAARDYLSANGLLNRGMHELAAVEYRRFLSDHPNHPKAPVARYGLAVCLVRTGQHQAAANELTALTKISPFEYEAEVLTLLGQARFAEQHYAQAATAFEEVVRDHAGHDMADDATALAVESHYRAGQYEAAVRWADTFLTKWPDSLLRERVEFFRSLSHMDRRDYDAAAEGLAALLRRFPNGDLAAQISLRLAQCYHHKDQLDKAEKLYRGVLKRGGPALAPDALYGLGLALQQQGRTRKAADCFTQLLDQFPGTTPSAAAHLHLGQCWYDQGKLERAEAAFEKVPSTDQQLAADAAYWQARCSMKAGRYTQAADRLDKALHRFAGSALRPEMTYDLAVARLRAGDPEGALAELQKFCERFGDHELRADAQYLLAATEHEQGRYDRSRLHCQAFLQQYPNHAASGVVAFLAGENEYLNDRYGAAADTFARFIAKYPQDPQLLKAEYRMGMSLYQLHNYERAEAVLRPLVDRGDDDDTLHPAPLALGEMYFHKADWKQSEQFFRSYLDGDGDLPAEDAATLKLGLALARQDKHDAALRQFGIVIARFEAGPHRLQAIFERGQVLVAMERLEPAAVSFEQVLKESPHSRFAAHASNHLGAIALTKGDYRAAADHFERVANLATEDDLAAEGRFQCAQSLMAGQQFERAARAFTEFLDHHAHHRLAARAHSELIGALVRQKRYADALAQIERYEGSRLDGADPALNAGVRYEKAWALKGLGKPEQAREAYRELLSRDGDSATHAHGLVELAEIEAEAENWKEAARLLERFGGLATEDRAGVPQTLKQQGAYRLGIALFHTGRFEESAAALEDFIKQSAQSPLLPSASFFCGEAYFKAGSYQRSAGHLRRVAEEYPSDELAAPSLLRLGECLAALQKWARSEQAFQQYLERFNEADLWFQAWFGVGWARENQGRYDDAVKAYENVVQRHQGVTAARAQFQIGQCHFAQKRYEPAVRELLKVDILYDYPEWRAAALFEAGRCFEQLGQQDKARQQFEQVARKYAKTQWARLAAERLKGTS